MNPEVCIHINNLSKRYKKSDDDCLKQISLSINSGEKFGILGPNGAGKTTLISILCGVIPPSGGNYQYFEQSRILQPHSVKKKIGFVPQDYSFYEDLTPSQNIDYFGALYLLAKDEIKIRKEVILSALGLSKVADKKIRTFSGGLKRRMNLAIGIIHKPSILFLDEPTVGADVQSKYAMMQYLNEVNKEGTTIIYTSHHMSEAEDFCNRIALIDNGKLIACDTLSNLFNFYKTSDLKSLFINLTGESFRDFHV